MILNCAVNARDGSSVVPEWAKSAVWYQIFPERFRNGDPKNDPGPKDMVGSWPHEVVEGWQVSKWTGDWYELQPWEQKDGKGFYFHCQQRRYGGDLQGIIEKLDYLKDLGINAIYMNPIFESPSLHKYDATYYHHVDNNFGPDPEGDRRIWEGENHEDPSTWKWSAADKLFLKLIEEAHGREIKIIIDGVFNHVGMTFWAFEDLKRNQQKSKFKDWFTIKEWDRPETSINEFDYEGWFGVRELPELREDENGLVKGAREHIRAVVQRWMDPNGDGNPEDGIDGWRLDVAEKVSPRFWKDFRKWTHQINPQSYIVGEVWWKDWENEEMFNAAPWLQGDMFDAVMNYRWAREAVRFFAGKTTKITSSEFDKRLEGFRKDYPDAVNYVLMNLYDSHDTDRLGSRIVNSDLSYDKGVSVKDNPRYDVRKPNDVELQLQKIMAVFQMTYVGAPMIYYGTEAGMWGGDDPDDRKPMLWPEFTYDHEKSHPSNQPGPADSNAFDNVLFQHYKMLTVIRHTYDALRRGDFTSLISNGQAEVFSYMRSLKGQHLIVVINSSQRSGNIDVILPGPLGESSWKKLLGQGVAKVSHNRLNVQMGPRSAEIFTRLI
ncbi:MAG: glycoside hydrolase family 13 protein [Ignavibacteriales bacterium]|nr:glycoside hydrolase family 13 protein [Ignavibacteriales bacterium]